MDFLHRGGASYESYGEADVREHHVGRSKRFQHGGIEGHRRLNQKKGADKHLIRIMRHYMADRELVIYTDQVVETMTITTGFPQGSVLGSPLWNVEFDDVLRLPLPRGVRMVAYADDLAILVSALAVPGLEAAAINTIEAIRE